MKTCLAVLVFIGFGLDFWEVVEDVEGSDVELVDREDERIAADDERKGSDLGDPVSDADRKFALKVLSAFLECEKNE